MDYKKVILIGIVVIVVAMVLSILVNGAGTPSSLISSKPQVECTVTLKNSLLRDTKIQSASCIPIGTCRQIFSLTGSLKSIFSDTGRVVVRSGGDQQLYFYDVLETQSQTGKVKLCTDASSADIIIYSDSGGTVSSGSIVTDEKVVQIA